MKKVYIVLLFMIFFSCASNKVDYSDFIIKKFEESHKTKAIPLEQLSLYDNAIVTIDDILVSGELMYISCSDGIFIAWSYDLGEYGYNELMKRKHKKVLIYFNRKNEIKFFQ